MPYTVCSRGRPIGVTALDFARFDSRFRAGWLHPNTEGEQVLEVVGALVPAMRAFMDRRDPGDGQSGSSRLPDRRSTACANVYEALHRVDSLELSLHHADGTSIATGMIAVQDCDRLLELARDVSFDGDDLFDGEDPFDGDDPFGGYDPADDDSAPEEMPRYQIYVELVDGVALP